MLGFDVLTIFPQVIAAYMSESILKRAEAKGLIDVKIRNLRDYTSDRHRTVDDSPYGGGAGMVFKIEPLYRALEALRSDGQERMVVLTSPQGAVFSQDTALRYSREKRRITLVCGRYEGIDERVRTHLVDEEVSIGDYVLTGGELAALVIIDGTARLVPGVLGDDASSREESFSWGILDYPHYTRPPEFMGMAVPEVLLSGNHQEIARWRRKEALRRTLERRPDLLEAAPLDDEDRKYLRGLVLQEDDTSNKKSGGD